MHLEMAKEYFKQKWSETNYWISNHQRLCKFKSSGIKKMFKELPVLECENDYTKAMNYLVLALTAYIATAEVSCDRLINVTIVCQVFKPMLTLQTYKNLKWSHPAIFTTKKCRKYFSGGNTRGIS